MSTIIVIKIAEMINALLFTLIIVADVGGRHAFAAAAAASAVGHGSSAYTHELLERLSKLRIEYRVDNWIHEAVHVSQPRGQDESLHARRTVFVQFVAYRVQDVTREKRHPTKQKHA